jgi:membrane protease subunit HflK
MDEKIREVVEAIQRGVPPKIPVKWIVGVVAGIAFLILIFTAYYQVEPNETGVVLRFGKMVRTAGSGPHFKIPFGLERVYLVKTDYQFKEEYGFRTERAGVKTQYSGADFTRESDMLTGDQNIASVTWVVQYRIRDAEAYLFHVRDVPGTIRDVAESTMRAVVGDMSFNEVIRLKRQAIELAVNERMQEILDLYGTGIDIKLVQLQDVHPPAPVKDSFDEVNRARQEMDQAINQAYQEYNKVIYRVRGEAEQQIKEAEGTKIERINEAKGDAARFTKLLREYRKAPEVTRQRLFLETMRHTLPRLRSVYIVDDSLKNMMPLLDFRGGKPAQEGGAR